MASRHCPECGDPLTNRGVCGSCGYTTKAKGRADPDWWRCADEYEGQRCAKVGVVSPSTHGSTAPGGQSTSGPWFCWQHVPTLTKFQDGITVPPPMGFAGLRAILKRPAVHMIALDAESIAERLAMQTEDQPV